VAAMYPLKIWMHLPGILQTIKEKHVDQPAKKVRHHTASMCCLCWTAMVGNNSL